MLEIGMLSWWMSWWSDGVELAACWIYIQGCEGRTLWRWSLVVINLEDLGRDRAMGSVHAMLRYDEFGLDCCGTKCLVCAGLLATGRHLLAFLWFLAATLNRVWNKRRVENMTIGNTQGEYNNNGSPDRDWTVSVSTDRSIRIWQIPDIVTCIVHSPYQSILCEDPVKSLFRSSTWSVWFPAPHMVTARSCISFLQGYRSTGLSTKLMMKTPWFPLKVLVKSHVQADADVSGSIIRVWFNACIVFAMWSFRF